MLNTLYAVALVLTALTISIAALYILALLDPARDRKLGSQTAREKDSVVFLFDDQVLTDTTPAGREILDALPRDRSGSDWLHLSQILDARFPNLTEQVGDLAELGTLSIPSADNAHQIDAEWRDGLARIELKSIHTNETAPIVDRMSFDAMRYELDGLRATAQHVPVMIWREDDNGKITWANKSYLDHAIDPNAPDGVASWPPQKLFDRPRLEDVKNLETPRRVAVQLPADGKRHWFELYDAPLGDETLLTAIPVDRVVTAEKSRAEFVTTLTKTFAHLPIGLAIFDRKRQLSLFNPALTDILAMSASFLVGQPTLFTFLDRLREKRMMPEPKDYVSWRQQMADLESAAVNGTYEETWSLPTGQTYRVTGRPHPDGAVAFLFEDITSEISLTRRFRRELEMGQSALDCIEDAIAIFSPGGVLSMSNAAYTKLWGNDPSTTLEDINLGDAIRTWRGTAGDTPVWRMLKEFVAAHGERQTWTDRIALLDGRQIDCQFVPMVRGATMARFSINPAQRDLQPEPKTALSLTP
ncbi:PAS fold [Aliiroseovarius halocynthiae]|uniref:Diguanylate cyclase n=1 Tax=Aliiroseovarius halocynthiae TaxID=985055 RepID=A0A545SNK1_9RHOB|nr:PAS-domain containing protein [Aliiroseovarius halocynthiae]TQV66562.1 diguanylate cyclase [Aliiroseovarius halocynthiae]SMR82570.1 PAS fold [Aliiroseovarius halocynthiae]